MDAIADSMDMSVSKLQEMVKDREAWSAAAHRVAKSRKQQRDLTAKIDILISMKARPLNEKKSL